MSLNQFRTVAFLLATSAIPALASPGDITGTTIRCCKSAAKDAECFERQPFDSVCIAARYQVGEDFYRKYTDKKSTVSINGPSNVWCWMYEDGDCHVKTNEDGSFDYEAEGLRRTLPTRASDKATITWDKDWDVMALMCMYVPDGTPPT
ncbi:hypothetical protein PMZ80_008176 [Knufia obscura]|nr:hypothetical protein PMZ80_008176 [Knufia obscura]